MTQQHRYRLELDWTGNLGTGTSAYGAYSRAHEIRAEGKGVIAGSSDPAFRGDADRYSPEELLLAALASCHMLWLLHLCADAGIVVLAYRDEPCGVLILEPDGGGRFREAVLHPIVTVKRTSGADQLAALHQRAHGLCYVARSVNFPVRCQPESRMVD